MLLHHGKIPRYQISPCQNLLILPQKVGCRRLHLAALLFQLLNLVGYLVRFCLHIVQPGLHLLRCKRNGYLSAYASQRIPALQCRAGKKIRPLRNEQVREQRTVSIPPDAEKQTTSGGIIMKKRKYTHIQALLPEIKAMRTEGKTQREIAERFGFSCFPELRSRSRWSIPSWSSVNCSVQ